MHKSPSAMLHLLWKESIQVRPLAIALLVLGAMIYAIQWLWGSNSYDAISILLPNLFALGSPVLMIGHEDETGTLAWTRSLPIHWRQAFWSRWIVAAVGLAIAWTLSLSIYGLITPDSAEVYHQQWLIHQTLYLLTFSYTLLAAGFMLAWWIRKPIPTLFALMALMSIVSTFSIAAASTFSGSHGAARAEDSTPLLAAAFVVLALLSAWFAKRTWSLPWGRKESRQEPQAIPAIRPYRPLESVPLLSPTARMALLWQHTMQSLPVMAPAAALGLLAALLPLITGGNPLHAPWQGLGTTLAVLVLGASTFLTDNTGRRHRFLADRGLSAWTVWWTRQVVPLALSLVIIALSATVWMTISPRDTERIGSIAVMVAVLTAAYICGQLTSQIVQRSIVALLAAPLVLIGICVSTVPLLELFGFLPSMLGWMILGLLVLWLTTLRLCRRWMDEQRDTGFYARALGWLGIAALFSIGGFFAQRWATIPAAMTDWQQQVLREAARLPDLPLASRSPTFVPSSSYKSVLDSPGTALSPQTIERHALPFQQMFKAAGVPGLENYQPQRIQGYAALLEASLRTVAVYRETETLHLSDLADTLESAVAAELASPQGRAELSRDQWQAFVDQLATAEQRRNARRRALLRSYEAFVSPPPTPGMPLVNSTMLGGYYLMLSPKHALGMERLRTRRIVDRAVRSSLEDLQQWPTSPHDSQRMDAWQAVWQDRYELYGYANLPTRTWLPESDTLIARLKSERASS